ncbi:MAG: N-acetylmuramoyl-L-alanine amidase AmiC [Alphaproteobacteria bacterium MarineAlpha3_Bin4]|nr:MAG: N-acetylmuramoyl-L-alanine amidase AmiC [Alphaproteobacteria bacterium MarineAlpha3_Bin4]
MWGNMGPHRLFLIMVAAAFLVMAAVKTVSAAEAVVTDARVGTYAQATRVVLEYSKPLTFTVFTLGNPSRVVVDMPEVGWRLPPRPLPKRTGLFDKMRYGLYKAGQSRIVLDVTEPVRIGKAFVIKPDDGHGHRFVLDLVRTTEAAFLKRLKGPALSVTAGGNAPAQPRAAALTVPQQSAVQPQPAALQSPAFRLAPRKPAIRPHAKKKVVVIDPGHGGVDPGAIGHSGTYEKHITLVVSRELKRQLEATGQYRVLLTRRRDFFIRLRDRVQFAREAGAELFISIHADTIKNRSISGSSVYTLSENASDKMAAELAEKENKADLIAGIDLTHETPVIANILISLRQRDSMNQSARFAALLIKHLKRRTMVLRNTHRMAGFAVLKAPDVPSVLIETGFLSNKTDEQRLRSRAYRNKMATAIVEAIGAYFLQVEEATRR